MKYSNRFKGVPGSIVKLKDIDPDFKDRECHKDAAGELAFSFYLGFCGLEYYPGTNIQSAMARNLKRDCSPIVLDFRC